MTLLPAATPSLRRLGLQLLPVPAAALIALVVLHGVRLTMLAIIGLVAIAVIAVAAARPLIALLVLVVYVPLQLVVLAYLFRLGLPLQFVKNLGYVKEAMVAGLLLAAAREIAAGRARSGFDPVDVITMLYLAIPTAYLLLPLIDASALGGQPWGVRLNAWRLDALFAVGFLACRRLTFTPDELRRVRDATLAIAVVMAAAAGWEFTATSSFNHFMVHTVELLRYKAQVLRVHVGDPNSVIIYGTLGGHRFVRVGSLLNDYLSVGFLTLISVGLGVSRLLTGSAMSWRHAVGTFAAAVTILLTLTRAPLVGSAVAVLLSFSLATGRGNVNRSRLAVLLLVGALALAPIASKTTLPQRIASIGNHQEADNKGHIDRTRAAWNKMLERPLGYGLGTNPVTGAKYNTDTSVIAENYYLQVGDELGAPAMLLFVAMMLMVLVQLRRVARLGDDDGFAGGLWLAGCGITVGALFLHVWNSLPVALTFWPLAGIALGRVVRSPFLSAGHGEGSMEIGHAADEWAARYVKAQ